MSQTTLSPSPSRPPRSSHLLYGVIIVVGLLSAVFFAGWRRVPAPPATGSGFSATPLAVDAESRILRLATFNIARGRGKDGKVDLSRTAEQLKGYDVVGLNEVGTSFFSSASSSNDVRDIGEALHAPWLFAPAEYRFWQPYFGNGSLSFLPIKQWLSIPLISTQSAGHRNTLLLRVERGGTVVSILITHLDRGQDRAAQLTSVATLFAGLAEPCILMGDLNTLPDDPLLKSITAIPGVMEPLAEMTDESPRRIDYIFTRGLIVRDAASEDAGASDHPLVWAELEIPLTPPTR